MRGLRYFATLFFLSAECIMSDSPATPWKQLALAIVTPMVGHPDAVEIEVEEASAGGFSVRAKVHPDDTGRVIGRGGSTVSALRALVEFAAVRAGTSATFDIVDG